MSRTPATRPTRRVVFIPHWHDNPYQQLLAAALATNGVHVSHVARRLIFMGAAWDNGRPDVVHIHAPDHFVVYRRSLPAAIVALVVFTAQLALLRGLGVKLVWTVHDAINHERRRPRMDRLSRLVTARLAHSLIVHCDAARHEVAGAIGIDPGRINVVPHGHYQDCYPGYGGDARTARAALALPDEPLMILFLGNLRRHKGLEPLLDAFGEIDRPGTLLVVAGEPFDAEMAAALEARAFGRNDVLLRFGTVPDAQIAVYLQAADVVVCPFTSSLTSGSLALALSFGRPVIAPRLGCAAEMVAEAGGFMYDANAPHGLLSALRAAVDARGRFAAMGAANQARMQQCDWATIARLTLAVYDEGTIG